MKIRVDQELCSGQGRCYSLVPELFSTDDEGYPDQLGQVIDVAPGHEDNAQLAIDACPEGAISITET